MLSPVDTDLFGKIVTDQWQVDFIQQFIADKRRQNSGTKFVQSHVFASGGQPALVLKCDVVVKTRYGCTRHRIRSSLLGKTVVVQMVAATVDHADELPTMPDQFERRRCASMNRFPVGFLATASGIKEITVDLSRRSHCEPDHLLVATKCLHPVSSAVQKQLALSLPTGRH